MNILMIDEESSDPAMIKSALRSACSPARVSEACGLTNGIGLLKAQTFDCVLLDLRRADQDGVHAISEFRQAGVTSPVVVLAGGVDEETALELIKAGASDCLARTDLSPGHLLHSVRGAVRLHRAENAAREARDQLRCQQARMLDSEKLLREQAKAASADKDRLLAVLSHELRTPLTPVLSLVEVLRREEGLPAPAREALEAIARNVEMEARLIDDLLDLSKIRQGEIRLDRREVDAHLLLRQAVEIWRDDMDDKRIHWTMTAAAANHTVHADPGRLQQVFWHLIHNAVKFTAEGGNIEARTWNEGSDTPRLVVEIVDDGIGINAQALERIFGAFERGEGALIKRTGGLGLGLAVSRVVIEAEGWKRSARVARRARRSA